MRIGLIIRGPIRPNEEVVAENIRLIKDQIIGHEIFTLLVTYSNCHDAFFRKHLNLIDTTILLKDPLDDHEYLKSKIFNSHSDYNSNDIKVINCFKMVYTSKIAIDYLKSHYIDFDCIILTRTDTKVKLNDNIENLFKKGDYVMPEVDCYCNRWDSEDFNDQFGIGDISSMEGVWNYGDYKDGIESLNMIMQKGPHECVPLLISKRNNQNKIKKNINVEIIR